MSKSDGAAVNFFDRFADKFDTLYGGKRNWLMRWVDNQFRRDIYIRFEMTFELLEDLNGKSVIDIGCGSGPYIIEAIERGAIHATGLEPAKQMLNLAKGRVNQLGMADRVSFIDMDFPSNAVLEKCDYAMVIGVMDYIADAKNFLSSLKKVFSEKAVISFPSRHWFRTPLRQIRYKVRGCPVFFYRRAEIERLILEAGFRRFDIRKIPGAGMDYVVCLYTPE
jgi:ubiquinone/menaquinone biosynthesis C-methylase UbiE